MPTPTPEALRHRAAARRWARSGEWGFTAASSAVNVTVVAAAGGSLLRILLAGLAPIVLAAMSHLLTKVLQSELIVSGVHGVVNMAVAGAVTLIGGGAFALSFDMLRRAAEPDHGELAWIFPVTLDLAIVVSAGVLAVIAWADEQDQRTSATAKQTHARRDEPAATHPVEAPVLRDEPAAVEQVEVPPLRDADPAPVTTQTGPLRDMDSSEPPADIATQESTLRDADTVEIPLTSGASREAAPVRRDVELPLRRLAVVPAPRRDREAERDVARSSQAASTAAQGDVDREAVRDVEPEPAAKQPVPLRDVEAASTPAEAAPLRDAHRDLAQRVIDAGRTTVAVEDTAAVIAAKASGLSNKKVSEATGVGESAVQRIWTAARELSEPVPVA